VSNTVAMKIARVMMAGPRFEYCHIDEYWIDMMGCEGFWASGGSPFT
jgi:hypothetical protein